MNSLKKKWQKPVMAMERFVANEYITGCDYKWKYEGTGVPGDYVCEGTFDSDDDFWRALLGWQGGDPIHDNSWKTDEAATFLTNNDSLGDELGQTPNYSGNRGRLHSYIVYNYYEFDLKDNSVYKYHNDADGKDYFSAEKFKKKRNYS